MARSASDPLVVVESGNAAELVLRNSHLQNGSGCAHLYPSSALITFSNVSFADCEDQAIWAQQAPLQFSDLTFGEGTNWGMELTGVSGSINGVDATAFTGSGAIVSLNSLVWLCSGDLLTPWSRGCCRREQRGHHPRTMYWTVLQELMLTAHPVCSLTLPQRGRCGTAFISHHGRSSDSLVVEQLNISGYSVGVSLHSIRGNHCALILRDARSRLKCACDGAFRHGWNPAAHRSHRCRPHHG